MPPEAPDYRQWDVSAAMKAEIDQVSEGVFGKLTQALPIQDYRVCWSVFHAR